MKKTNKAIKALLLTAVLTSAFTCTTYAAQTSSFSDVPATHWSYDAVTSLAKAGLLDGTGEGAFRGDRAMSRYEMAILVSKTIDQYKKADASQKAVIDKLSAEFASELNSLGARVAKVEAKTNTWISGETRMRAMGDSPSSDMPKKLSHADKFDFRQRIAFKGNINEDWSWTGRLATNGHNRFGDYITTNAGSAIELDQANVTAKNILGMDTVRAGRSALDFFSHGMIGGPGNKDGLLVVKKIGDVKFTGWTGNIKGISGYGATAENSGFTTGQLDFKVNKVNMKTGYYWGDTQGTPSNLNIVSGGFNTSQGYLVGFDTRIGNLLVFGDYVGSKLSGNVGIPNSPSAYMIQITNSKTAPIAYQVMGMVNPAKTGTDAWMVQYRSIDPGAFAPGSGNFDTAAVTNFTPAAGNINFYTKGSDNVNALFLAYSKVVAKNVVASLEYQDLKIKNKTVAGVSQGTDKTYQAKIELFY